MPDALILYITEDGRSRIQLRAERETVWLAQSEMAELFDTSKQNVSLHLKNLFEDGELEAAATVKESLTVPSEGSRGFSIGSAAYLTTDRRGEMALNRLGLGLPRRVWIVAEEK